MRPKIPASLSKQTWKIVRNLLLVHCVLVHGAHGMLKNVLVLLDKSAKWLVLYALRRCS